MMSNDAIDPPLVALAARMKERGLTPEALARRSGVSIEQVRRLLKGSSSPRRSTADALAAALGSEPKLLWPAQFAVAPARPEHSHAVTLWQSRAEVPARVWRDHFSRASRQLDVLVYGGTFLFDSVPRFVPQLQDAVAAGVPVRVLVGDPRGHAVRQRGDEEQIEHSLSGRCELTLARLAPLRDADGTHVRVHATPLYTSTFRADDTMIVNPHIYGSPASDNPAILLERSHQADLFDAYATSFERIWQQATTP